MIEEFLLTVNQWIAGGTAIAALGCFVWGMISVMFSPCHLASIPLIIAYVGGQHQTLSPKQAGYYAFLFTLGLFITIAVAFQFFQLFFCDHLPHIWQVRKHGRIYWNQKNIRNVNKLSATFTPLSQFA